MKKIAKKQMNRQYMISQVLAFINDHGGVFKDDPKFQTHASELQNRMDRINTIEQDLITLRMPLGERKEDMKKDFYEHLSVLSDTLNELAHQQDLSQILQFLSNFKTRLRNSSEQSKLIVARECIEMAETYRTEIEGLNKGKQTLDEAQDLYNQYAPMALRPARQQKEASNLNDEYKELIEQAIAYIRVHIRSYFNRERKQYPQLLDLLDDHMNIPEFGKRYTNPDDAAEPNDLSSESIIPTGNNDVPEAEPTDEYLPDESSDSPDGSSGNSAEDVA